jgi:hypothetical protein
MKNETNTAIPSEEMELINALSRRELSEEEVYVFPLILCDNETDRDCERFSVSALETLAEMFVGKTGIFDHDPKGSQQTARIYTAEVETDPSRKTQSGEAYTCIRAKAYLMRTDKTADLIAEIDGGIKKEVSVCCSVKSEICSICGADRKSSPCSHVKGEVYGGKICVGILTDPTDAYEWSFVAVPAQPNAGITKAHSINSGHETVKALKRRLDDADRTIAKACSDTIAEIIRLGQFCVPAYSPETVKAMCRSMNLEQLIGFKEETRKLAVPENPHSLLLTAEKSGERQKKTNSKFKMIH